MVVDLSKKVRRFNQLWIKWDNLIHQGNGKISLNDVTFFGPVMSDCDPIEESGEIQLDLTKHYLLLIPKPYYVKMSWDSKISQNDREARFSKITLHDSELGHLKLLKDDDQLLLDCTDQTTEARQKGKLKVAFDTMVYDCSGQPYSLTTTK